MGDTPALPELPIWFGSAFAIDQFGFVRRGRVMIDASGLVTLTGPRHWSAYRRVLVFLAVIAVPFFALGILISPLLGFVIIHYFCASAGAIRFRAADLREVTRRGRKITFKASDERGKLRRALFKAKSAAEAEAIERALRDAGAQG